MITRSKVGTFKPNPRFHGHTSHISPLPKSPSIALSDPHYDTFSLVVKPATIRTVLSLALARNWHVHKLDVKNVFLNGDLSETVYMYQSPSFVDSRFPHHVCRLQRSLYGLKQAPRAWFQRFVGYAFRVGFTSSRCDSSLFIYQHGTEVAYLFIYVDDIVLTTLSTALLQRIISSLHKEFDMTDLGALNYFLGISVTRDTRGMFLSQKKYAMDFLERTHMSNCNSTRTPVDTESKLGSDGDPVSDSTLYRSLAGGLQYLTFTRPDISYAVQQICLHMHDPREPHLAARKRVLRYVRGTLDHGLQLHVSSTSQLNAYTDADWAGCLVTRRSTSDYCVFLENNIVSWSAKRQVTLSCSSVEAEYRGVTNVIAETTWTRNLLRELHNPLFTATLVYCDNISALYMSTNPVQHQRTKHIEIDIHFVRDMVARGQKPIHRFCRGAVFAIRFLQFWCGFCSRPPMLYHEGYVSWQSRLMRYIDNKLNGKYLIESIPQGNYQMKGIFDPVDPTKTPPIAPHTHLHKAKGLKDEDLARYLAYKEAINIVLLGFNESLSLAKSHICSSLLLLSGARTRLKRGGGDSGFALPRAMRLYVPKFNGTDTDSWIFSISENFALLNTPVDQRLMVVCFNLEGEAAKWFCWMTSNKLITIGMDFWKVCVIVLDPINTKIRRATEARLMDQQSRTVITTTATSITGQPKPATLWSSGSKTDVGKPPLLPTPTSISSNIANKPLAIKGISLVERQERLNKGLCFNCDNKWARGHKL
nr:ribonuclease H-like domain-containing protein [Tanacetum cinerariifolium]